MHSRLFLCVYCVSSTTLSIRSTRERLIVTCSTVRTLFHEISTPKTRAKAFSYWSISNSVGNFLGPFIGV